LTTRGDDESVVVVEYGGRRLTLPEYLSGDETNRPFELAFGVVREPPAPTWEHQRVVGRAFTRLDRHVTRYGPGRVVQSPVDVVLDRDRALVVQPDVVFVATERLSICKARIWGAPDLAVEVLSMGTARHDRTVKLSWFQRYGVRECWLVDPIGCEMAVVTLAEATRSSRVSAENQLVRSSVLPRLRLRVADLFT
jgi:Uma2 family endonuclease